MTRIQQGCLRLLAGTWSLLMTAGITLLVVTLPLMLVVLPACGDDGSSGGEPASDAQCREWQADFDMASDDFDDAGPGTPGADSAIAAMDAADRRLEEGGCYG